jgi:type III pantothenate kinase
MYARTSQLRRAELVEPRHLIGRTTADSIRSGAIYGYTAQVDGLCRRFADELGECTVVSTGGSGGLIAPLSEMIDHHEPWLTLHGLRIIFERNAT